MSKHRSETVHVVVERKSPELPRFIVVPAVVAERLGLKTTAVVVCTANGVGARRTLKRWDADRWFIDLPAVFCKRAGIDTGATIEVTLETTDTGPPSELVTALQAGGATRAWAGLSECRRRELSEHVRAGVRAATRARRAAKIAESLPVDHAIRSEIR